MTPSPPRPRSATLALILGALTALGPLASSLVGVLNDGSARPMAAVMAACGVAAWIAGKVASRGEVSLDRASASE